MQFGALRCQRTKEESEEMTEQALQPATRPTELTDATNLAMTAKVREASALAKSSLVPEAYRDSPANVMIAMEMANRIGASVMAVMQNLHVIHGKPSFSSSFLIATVNASGRFSPLRFTFDGEGDEYGCTAHATDIKTGEECVGVKITRAMAKAEGWSAKAGSKWKTMEPLMMTYRSAAFWIRVYAPELSLGIHTTDEAEDIGRAYQVDGPVTTVRPIRPRALQAIAGDAPAPEAPAEQEAPQEPAGDAGDGTF